MVPLLTLRSDSVRAAVSRLRCRPTEVSLLCVLVSSASCRCVRILGAGVRCHCVRAAVCSDRRSLSALAHKWERGTDFTRELRQPFSLLPFIHGERSTASGEKLKPVVQILRDGRRSSDHCPIDFRFYRLNLRGLR